MITKLDDIYFNKFRDLIYEKSGIHFTEVNRPILESRLREKLKKNTNYTLSQYFTFLQQDEQELKSFLDSVTTNLTRFFRNSSHFKAFSNFVINELKKKREKKIRLWSAGCSSGEEPYSLAMVLKDNFNSSWDIEIVASDISVNSLMKAKEGYYSKEKINGIPPETLSKYLIPVGNGYQIKEEIKQMIIFDYHNLIFDSGLKDFDVVFCRNVLIYFDTKAQEKVVNKFYEMMNSYSFLFIGHSESLFGMKTKFIFAKEDDACFYVKNEK